MALYEYISPTGDRLMVERPMTKAPKIGSTIKRNGKVYRRAPSTGTPPIVSKSDRIVGWSLGYKEQMDPELHGYVDGWNAQNVPCFDSDASAKKFAAQSRRIVDKTDAGVFYEVGDGPSGVDTAAAAKAGKRIKFDK